MIEVCPQAWDLGLVLRHLVYPYELIPSAGELVPVPLTQTTAFVMSLATAAWVCELHAIDVTQIKFGRNPRAEVHLNLIKIRP